jgi:endonuclease YncB( thermonuclease family)
MSCFVPECNERGCISQNKGITSGMFRFGICKKDSMQTGKIEQMIHDGDTIKIRTLGNMNLRFLGIDTPEVCFQLETTLYNYLKDKNKKDVDGRQINEYIWSKYLDNPFADDLTDKKAFGKPEKMSSKEREYYDGLVDYLKRNKIGKGTAENHFKHSMAARDVLIEEVKKDVDELHALDAQITSENFILQVSFGWEVMDRYGRLLGIINCFQQKNGPQLPSSYNERLLEKGVACIYTIWPGVDPRDRSKEILELLNPFKVKKANEIIDKRGAEALKNNREKVKNARKKGLGIFYINDPLKIEPFELRFLGRRSPPDRWVIDLSSDEKIIRHPFNYHKIPNMEDRLYINPEYLPLFTEIGWEKE